MPHAARSTAVLAACIAMVVGGVATAQADPVNKVQICHGTASATNPYVLITVDDNALAGHFDGTDLDPGHGKNNNADILLTDVVRECPSGGGEGGGEE